MTVVSCKRHLPQPVCHLDHKSTNGFFERLALLPVPDYDSPKGETFTLFSDFPAELRLQVWQYAISFERVVEIQYMNATIRHGASPRPPAILHVCRESRYEALKVYKLCFNTKKVPKSIYINPAHDILFFRVAEQNQTWQHILGPNSLWRRQLSDVRRIAFAYIGRFTGRSSFRFMKKTICSFPNLEELIILWAEDTSMRSYEGRGANIIEGGPGHTDSERQSSWRSAMRWKAGIVEAWDREQWWRVFGREPPSISVRHWCIRNESEW